jgi:hypothetical protein
MTSLRKVVNLFKHSNTDDDDRRYGRLHVRLFALVPSVPVLPVPVPKVVPRDGSAVVSRLIQRTRVTTSQPILSTHTITVTTSEDAKPAMSLPVERGDGIAITWADEEPSKHASLPIISGPEVEQEHEDHNNGPTVDTKFDTESIDTPDALIPETHEELQERGVVSQVGIGETEIECFQKDTGDVDINNTIIVSTKQDVEPEIDKVDTASGAAIQDTDIDSAEEDIAPVPAALRVDHEVYDHDATRPASTSQCDTELEDHDISSVGVEDETVSLPLAKGIIQDGDGIDAGPTGAFSAPEKEQTPAISDTSSSSSSEDDPNAVDLEILCADWPPPPPCNPLRPLLLHTPPAPAHRPRHHPRRYPMRRRNPRRQQLRAHPRNHPRPLCRPLRHQGAQFLHTCALARLGRIHAAQRRAHDAVYPQAH